MTLDALPASAAVPAAATRPPARTSVGDVLRQFSLPLFILTIHDQGAQLSLSVKRQVTRRVSVDSLDDRTLRSLARRLRAVPELPIAIQADFSDLTVGEERLPPAGLLDRPRLIKNRLRFLYPRAAASSAISISTDEDRRQLVLCAAIPDQPQWQRWSAFLTDLPNPLVELSAAPVDAVPMAFELARGFDLDPLQPGAWTVIDGPLTAAGRRQLILQEGRLVLTRALPAEPLPLVARALDGTEEQDAKTPPIATAELDRTLAYLARLGFDRRRDRIDVLALGTDIPTWEGSRSGLPFGRIAGVSAARAARMMGLRSPITDTVDLLPAWRAEAGRPRLRFTPAAWAAAKRMEQRKNFISMGRAAAMSGAVTATLLSAVSLANLDAVRADLAAELDGLQTTRADRTAQLRQFDLDADQARGLIAEADGAAQLSGRMAQDVPTLMVAVQDLAAIQRLSAGPADSGSARLDVTLRLPASESSGAMRSRLNSITARLAQALPSYTVTLVRGPLGLGRDGSLSGSIVDGEHHPAGSRDAVANLILEEVQP